jgi:hypothetical protein
MDYRDSKNSYFVDDQKFINRMHCVAYLLRINFTFDEADQYTNCLLTK